MARILIVDDSKFMRRILRDTLESGGHEVIGEAENGAEAIDLFKSLKPDLVTMDITMAGRDGIHAVTRIKSIDTSSKIVVVSALSEKVIRNIENDINPDAFINKPFEKKELLDTIKKVIG